MRLWFLPAFFLASAHAAAPLRYDMTMSIASVPVSGGASFGKKFFFARSNQVAYRVLPAGGSEDPSANWKFWSQTAGARDIFPAAGYGTLDVAGMNAAGAVIGRSFAEAPSYRESALYWTVAGGSAKPAGFDAGYSGLVAMNAAGQAAGYSDSGTFEVVAWDARNPAAGVTTIVLPAGCTSPQIAGVSGSGKVLLYLRDSGGNPRAAIWDGVTSELIGPAPAETFYPSNCAINSAGDVAMLVFTAGGAAALHYIPAADRDHWLTFSFDGPIGSSGAYNLRISDAGLASFDSAMNGVNTVAIVSARRAEQRTFTGYRSYLNNPGALVFGNQGNLLYWDAGGWTGLPAVVPVTATASSGGLDIEGFNDDGHLLALVAQGATRSLGILSPAVPTPAVVTVRPERRRLRLDARVRVRIRLVETLVSGNTFDSAIRYVARGRLPKGMRFRVTEAILTGVPKKAGRTTLRVAAAYTSGGVKQRSPYAKIKVVVRNR